MIIKANIYFLMLNLFMISCNLNHKNTDDKSFNSKDGIKHNDNNIKINKDIFFNKRKLVVLNDVKLLEKESYSCLKQMEVTEFLRLSTRMIDSNADGYFEHNKIKKKVENFFPDKNDEGFCVINWEREAFQKLKSNKHFEFNLATNQYIELIKFIKKLRPNIKVGIYGMPFRQNTIRNPNRFYAISTTENILKEVDFLAPSLYLLYSEKEIGEDQMKNYLKTNIERALKVAGNKPVIPYVGYRVYSRHSQDSWELISPLTFKTYIEYLLNYKSDNNQQIDGFIVWNGDFVDYREKRNTYAKRKVTQTQFTDEYNNTTLFYYTLIDEILDEKNKK